MSCVNSPTLALPGGSKASVGPRSTPLPSAHAPAEARRERLRAALAGRRLALLIVTKPANIFYLTGFRGDAGVAVVGSLEGFLWVDPRYTLEARGEARGVEVIEARIPLLKAVGRWLRQRRPGKVGYDESHLTCAALAELKREAGSSGRRAFGWQPAGGLVEELRATKDAGEIARIRKAGELTATVFEALLSEVRPGARESDLAAEIEYRLRRAGAEGVAFDTIVASGPRGARPHARASAKLLQGGELVIFDLGAIVQGYAADMTRTVYLGRPGRRASGLYRAVLEAQQEALGALEVGARAEEVDAAARRALRRRGLGKYFTHSTGHGVGIEVHERPRLGRGEKSQLPPGCVVTAEPGIYLEGFGGVRTEDTVVVTEGGTEILTPASKNRWAIE